MADLTIENLRARIQKIHDAEDEGSVTNVAVADILESLLRSDLIELVKRLESDVATCVNFMRTKGIVSGIAPLDWRGKVDKTYLPPNVVSFGGLDDGHISGFIDDQYFGDYSDIVFNKETRRLVAKTKEGYYCEWHDTALYGIEEAGKGVIPYSDVIYFDVDEETVYLFNGAMLVALKDLIGDGYIKSGSKESGTLGSLSLTNLNYANILTILRNGATIARFDSEKITFNLPLDLAKKPVGEGIDELKKDIIKNLPSQACVVKVHQTTPPDSYYRIENSDEELKEMASAIFDGDKLRADANIILQVDGKNHHMSDLSILHPTGDVYVVRAIFLETVQHVPFGDFEYDSTTAKTGLLGYYVLTISNNPSALGTRVEYFEIEQPTYKPPYLELTHKESHYVIGEPFTLIVGVNGYAAIERAFQDNEPLAVRIYNAGGNNPHLTTAEIHRVTTDRPNFQIWFSYCGVPYISELINDTIKEIQCNRVNTNPAGYEQFFVKSE